MERLSLRLTEAAIARLEVLAAERGQTKAVLVRELVLAGIEGVPPEPLDLPSEEELLRVLAENVRGGSVAAARILLAREDEPDPRERALQALRCSLPRAVTELLVEAFCALSPSASPDELATVDATP
jgi:predicted DNA-binding protein